MNIPPFFKDLGSQADNYSGDWISNGYLWIALAVFAILVIFVIVKGL